MVESIVVHRGALPAVETVRRHHRATAVITVASPRGPISRS